MQRSSSSFFRANRPVFRVFLIAFAAALALFLIRSGSVSGQQSETRIAEDPNGVPYVAGELIVAYEEDLSSDTTRIATDPTSDVGGEVVESLPAVDSQVVEFSESGSRSETETLEEIRRELERSPEIESADYNYLREVAAVPNDAFFDRQWNLRKIAAPVAWNVTEGEGTTVSVIDTGADLDHPDLAGKISESTNTAEEDESAEETTDGHGTHVAGIVAANTNNQTGVAGACPGCGLLIAKVEDDLGYIRSSDVVEAINWSANRDADVINISLSGEGFVKAERRAVKRARSEGSVVVAAAGNVRSNIKSYPAGYPESVAVAATTQQDTKENYSNFGNWIDLSAPGTAYSTIPDGRYTTMRGTSMASPLVAGTAALISSQGNLTPSEIEEKLTSKTVDLGERGRDATFGYGRLDAAASVGARERNTFPTVTDLTPKSGATIESRRLQVAATVRDAQSDLEKADIELFVDGEAKGFTFNATTGRLKREGTFAPGGHKVKVVVSDGWGLTTRTKWTFEVAR